MKKTNNVIILLVMMSILVLLPVQSFAATTNSLCGGNLTITDSLGNGTGNETSYKITAKGSIISKQTNNITITNESGTDAQISFDYTAASANVFTIDGDTVATSETCSKVVAAGGTISIVLKSNSGLSNTTATLTLTNISLNQITGSSDMTFEFDNTLGTVTAGGTAVNSGEPVTIAPEGVTMVATPATGAKFVAWVDEDDKKVSTNATYTQMPLGNITVKALFTKDTPYFMVDDSYICSDLNVAVTKGSKVVLLFDGTLPAGDYTIPPGVTLLIPFDANDSMYTAEVGIGVQGYTKPSAYRTL